VIGTWPGLFPGQASFDNGEVGILTRFNDPGAAIAVYGLNDGSHDARAVNAFDTLMGSLNVIYGDTPVFWETIASNIVFTAAGGPYSTLLVANYPTYYVYVNGQFLSGHTRPQAPDPSQHFYTNPYPFGAVPCSNPPIPGGRCGDATLPADLTARVPDFLNFSQFNNQ
jgi:hypothetical protein